MINVQYIYIYKREIIHNLTDKIQTQWETITTPYYTQKFKTLNHPTMYELSEIL